jgi:hypothetical protein
MSTRENPIDLTSSDDEKDCKKKRKLPEMIVKKERKLVVNKCYICEEAKEGLRATGNSLGFVCEACMEDIPEMGFCNGCDRYEETDGENFCGRCQFELTERSKRASAKRRKAPIQDTDTEEDSSNETEVDSDDEDN